MPFSRGLNCGPDPRQGPSGGLKIRIFHPHDFTKTLILFTLEFGSLSRSFHKYTDVFFGRRASVDTSVDAAGMSACATIEYETVFMKWCTKLHGFANYAMRFT